MSKMPKALSPGEEGLARDCACYHVKVEREYQFAPPRSWRADFCVVEAKLLIEIEGGTWVNGRHNRPGGFAKDAEKSNTAALMGYFVYRFTGEMVESGVAVDGPGDRPLIGVRDTTG